MNKYPERFDKWNEEKKYIEFHKHSPVRVETWELWRYKEGINIGHELSKDKNFLRVGLVLNTNLWNKLILVSPITTKYHDRLKERYMPIYDYKK